MAALALLWLDLCRQLSYIWSTNEQYAYGWFVPILAIGLFLKKWPGRPLTIDHGPQTTDSQLSTLNSQPPQVSNPAVNRPFLLSAFYFLLFLLLPLRIIHEVNQDWSFCSFLLTLAVVALSLYAVFFMGGWPWIKHFAFPICFILVAVRWPYRLENSLTYRLTHLVTALTVDLLGWLGVPALQRGNLIELSTGVVGVDEACSGIRSFQSTFMAAWFLGELYLLSWPRRFLLVALGLPMALLFNVFRTSILAGLASSSGLSAVDKWHDSAGMSIFLVCFACLWLIAVLLKKRTKGREPRAEIGKQKAGITPADQPQVSGFIPHPFPRWFSLSLAVWVPFVVIATEAWYRSHESNRAQTATWWAHFPTNLPSASEIPISKLARSKLKYDQRTTLAWEEPDGSKWSAYCFRWDAGVATSRMAARDHRPEYCLGGSGYNCQADLGIRYLTAQGLELPFRTYIFDRSGVVLYVFHCLWEDGAAKQKGFGTSKYLDRLETVLEGKRCLGQQTLEIIVSGYAGMEEAEQAVRQRLPSLIQLGAAPGARNSRDQPDER